MSGRIPAELTPEQWHWLRLYCGMSGEEPRKILKNYAVVECHCSDPFCRGWKLELRPYTIERTEP